MTSGARRTRVVCLLPARNAADHLPAWFESVARVADAVVALDDGSTDETASLLEGHELVATLLRNPRREGFRSWDDAANRTRLLAAAAALEPDWIISIDADGLVPPESAARLRRFIEEQAVPGIAYGFPLFRMIGDAGHHDGVASRIYRLFAHDPADVLPNDRLHFVPVPTAIPRGRWLATDISMQHLAERTPEDRRRRARKYTEADPDHQWSAPYHYREHVPGDVRPWRARAADDPVVLAAHFPSWDRTEPALDWPTASVVLVVDDANLASLIAVHGVVEDLRDERTEVLVVARDADVADDFARMRPGATVVTGPATSTPTQARNIGLRVARGDYVLFLDGEADLRPGALQALIDVHDRGNAMVALRSTNPTPSAAGWAAWLGDRVRWSFAREPLVDLGGFDETLPDGSERVAHDRLLRLGHHVGHTQLVTAHRRTEVRNPADLLRARFAQGRSIAGAAPDVAWRALVAEDVGELRRLRAGAGGTPPGAQVLARVRPLLLAGVAARWSGVAWELALTTARRVTER